MLVLWGVAIFILLCATGLAFMKKSSVSNFSCQGDAIFNEYGNKLTSSVKFSFIDGNGRYAANSIYTQSGFSEQTFSNTIYFNYWREGEEIIMISNNDNARSETLKPLAKLPDFFLYRDRGIAVKILRPNHNSFIFIHEDTPIFYCNSIN